MLILQLFANVLNQTACDSDRDVIDTLGIVLRSSMKNCKAVNLFQKFVETRLFQKIT